ncbi:hypothetical protein FRB94_006386 [Tulasnella sp. JGI-2019a]|nr:hypothetical protein FRB94_006386 [Tulasnella sp. JGI-2019a]KAG9005074.1 hypothetical protein FRB93_009943 [Tulasnella sp. JGI-2019a]
MGYNAPPLHVVFKAELMVEATEISNEQRSPICLRDLIVFDTDKKLTYKPIHHTIKRNPTMLLHPRFKPLPPVPQPLCLRIEEILLSILSNLGHDADHKALAVTSLTCKRWNEISLEFLWKDIRLEDILSVLSPTRLKGGKLRFERPPTTHDWSRFDTLARRVRSLRLETRLDNNILVELSLTKQPVLFPGLQALAGMYTMRPDHLLPLLSPTMRSLTFGLYGGMEREELGKALQFMNTVHLVSPQLVELHLSAIEISAETANSITELLRSLPRLRTLGLGLESIGYILPTLTGLSDLENFIVYDVMPGCFQHFIPTITMTLHNLKSLGLFCKKSAGIPKFILGLVPYAKLTSIQLGRGGLEGDLEIDGLFEAITEHQLLERLIIYTCQEISLSLSNTGMLQSCISLTHLTLSFWGSVMLTDDDVERLVASLPKLIEFTLMGRSDISRSGETGAKPTLRALLIITMSCPSIQHIGLHVDLSGPIPKNAYKLHPNLRSFNFGSSILSPENIHPMALFLSQMSHRPDKLEIRSGDCGWHGGWLKVWEEVLEQVRILHKAEGT